MPNYRDTTLLASIVATHGNKPFCRRDIDAGAINRLIHFRLLENLTPHTIDPRDTTPTTTLRVR